MRFTRQICEKTASQHPYMASAALPSKSLHLIPDMSDGVFTAMRDSLSEVLKEAVRLRNAEPDRYTDLVLAAIEKQESLNWHENLGGMIALVEEARIKRGIIAPRSAPPARVAQQVG